MDGFESALVAELARKSGLVWVTYGGRTYPVWHVYVDDAICVVGEGDEQPLPGITDESEVEVLLRSKATRFQVAHVRARVEALTPQSAQWDEVTAALVGSRLNLLDRDAAPGRWSEQSTVVRLEPYEVLTAPGNQPDSDDRARPVDSPALTVTSPPYVVHRRQSRTPPLTP